jgi:broad specificity phosphatase PhoE
VLPELHEMRYGDWEGLRTEDMWADPELQPQLAAFWDDPIGNPPPGGETLDDFAARNLRGWQALAAHAPGEHLLVVAHGGTNRMLIGNALGLPTHTHWGFEIPYACLSRLRVYREPGQRFNVVLAFHNGRAG